MCHARLCISISVARHFTFLFYNLSLFFLLSCSLTCPCSSVGLQAPHCRLFRCRSRRPSLNRCQAAPGNKTGRAKVGIVVVFFVVGITYCFIRRVATRQLFPGYRKSNKQVIPKATQRERDREREREQTYIHHSLLPHRTAIQVKKDYSGKRFAKLKHFSIN
jgi:hypothetical protein